MGADESTLAFYTAEAAAYAEHVDPGLAAEQLRTFVNGVPPGGDVLDFGCGSGWAAAHFRDHGLHVHGFDGSEGLAAIARERYRLEVNVGSFETFAANAEFDGVWASFSLLHDSRSAMSGHLNRLYTALRPGGLLYLGLKDGTGTKRDALGRQYTYFTAAEIDGLLRGAGFGAASITTEIAESYDGTPEPCLHIFTRRD